MRVLVLAEEPLVAALIKLTLTHGVYTTRVACTVGEATSLLVNWHPHLGVIDVRFAGTELIQQFERSDQSGRTRIPVLALTGRGDLKTKLAAFDLGVDDILTLPFLPEELLARVLVITQRTYGPVTPLTPVIRVGGLESDIVNCEVRSGASVVPLTRLEQALLYLLAANADRVLSREEILDSIWGTDLIAATNVVDRHIRCLRVKLQNGRRQPPFIATKWRQGYRFIPVSSDTHDPILQ